MKKNTYVEEYIDGDRIFASDLVMIRTVLLDIMQSGETEYEKMFALNRIGEMVQDVKDVQLGILLKEIDIDESDLAEDDTARGEVSDRERPLGADVGLGDRGPSAVD